MMFTHDEMLSAVRAAGENGQPFTCGAVRDCLGVKSGDREKMNQFHRRFRTFQKDAADEIEKVGKNAYRLKHPERARTTAAPDVEAPVIAHVAEAEALEVAPEELIEVVEVAESASAAVAAESIEVVEPGSSVAASEIAEIIEPAASAIEAAATPEATLQPIPAVPPAAEPLPSSMEVPFRMIEIDFDVQDLPPPPRSQPVPPAQPVIRAWLDRGQRLGRRVAEFFGRA